MKKDDTVDLRHILGCIRRVTEDITEGREHFMESHTLQDAVLRNLTGSFHKVVPYRVTLRRRDPMPEYDVLAMGGGMAAGARRLPRVWLHPRRYVSIMSDTVVLQK